MCWCGVLMFFSIGSRNVLSLGLFCCFIVSVDFNQLSSCFVSFFLFFLLIRFHIETFRCTPVLSCFLYYLLLTVCSVVLVFKTLSLFLMNVSRENDRPAEVCGCSLRGFTHNFCLLFLWKIFRGSQRKLSFQLNEMPRVNESMNE